MALSDSQQKTLRAAINRIIPADDYPGAWESGVGEYIARQLNGDLRAMAGVYEQGLAGLNSESVAMFNVEFDELSATKQDELLSRIEAGDVSKPWPVSPKEFFAMLVNHCAEGYYSDPGNGGNRDARSWEMIGFDPVRKVIG